MAITKMRVVYSTGKYWDRIRTSRVTMKFDRDRFGPRIERGELHLTAIRLLLT